MRFLIPWGQLSDAGDWVVVVFGMLLWACCLFSLFGLGVRVISTVRHKGRKRRSARQARHWLDRR